MVQIEQHVWGMTPEGEAIIRYTLRNDSGAEVQLTNYGAAIVSVKMPDREGRMADVVLGYKHPEGYFFDGAASGKSVGRCANRIAFGQMTVERFGACDLDRADAHASRREHFAYAAHGAPALAEEQIEGPRRGAGGDDDGLPPFETRLRNSARGFAHEDRHEPFEEQFQPRGHPAPVGRCPDDEQVGAADRFAQLVRRVVRQRTDAGHAAAHTSRAGGDRRPVELGLDRFRSGLPGRRGRCVERLRDDPRGVGRCIEQQYVHRGGQPFSVISSS